MSGPQQPEPPAPSLLQPTLVARLERLSVRARQVVEGTLSGLHRSPHHGQSIEFAEHKEYSPGDEIKHIDWKAYGRFDKYYVKQYEQETNLRAWILLDTSASMGFSHEGVRKLDYAQVLAASLAYLLIQQGDSVGLLTWAGGPKTFLPARSAGAHLHELLRALEGAGPEGESDLGAATRFLNERARRRGLVIVISDLLDPDPRTLSQLRLLRARQHDVAVFHLLDRAELELPYEDPALFVGVEDARELMAHPAELRASYQEEVAAFIDQTRRGAREADVDYRLVPTDQAYDRTLIDFLGQR